MFNLPQQIAVTYIICECDMGSHVKNTWYNIISHDKTKFVVAFETTTIIQCHPTTFTFDCLFKTRLNVNNICT